MARFLLEIVGTDDSDQKIESAYWRAEFGSEDRRYSTTSIESLKSSD